MITDPLVLVGLIAVCTAVAFWLDRNIAPLSKLGASLIAIVLGALLSNTGIVPADSPVYGVIAGPVTMLAIAWLLLAVNLSDLKKAGAPMIGAFAIAATGTAIGAVIASLLFQDTFGDATWRLAGTLTGSYSGGSVNFVAVGEALELPDELYGGATAADNVMTAVWLGATLMLPRWLGRWFPTPVPESDTASEEGIKHPFFHRDPISTLDVAMLVGTGFVLLLLANWVGDLVPAIPAVLWLTTFALLVGHLTPIGHLPGSFQLGNLALHFFFVVIGIFSLFDRILEVGLAIFWFTALIVLVQGVFAYSVGRLFKLDVGTVSVASQASIGGPSSALAVAVSRKWNALVLPGIIVGLLGYAVGTYLGFGVGRMLQALGVG